MKTNRQKTNWILDALLFTGFLVSFALDLTGLPMHQWIGVFGGLLVVYHLARHWDWVTAVTTRFFRNTSAQARIYYLLDAVILLGFYLILVTGLFISSWLNLPLTNYTAWSDLHATVSIVTLVGIVLKIGLHGRWIVRVARQAFFTRSPRPASAIAPVPVTKPVPVLASNAMTRREFLKLMGIVSAASVVALTFTLNDKQDASAATVPETSITEVPQPAGATPTTTESNTVSTPAPTETAQTVTQSLPYTAPSTTYTSNCFLRCDKRCSYPGNCRRYQDTNNNNLCDLGECM